MRTIIENAPADAILITQCCSRGGRRGVSFGLCVCVCVVAVDEVVGTHLGGAEDLEGIQDERSVDPRGRGRYRAMIVDGLGWLQHV